MNTSEQKSFQIVELSTILSGRTLEISFFMEFTYKMKDMCIFYVLL